MIGERPAETRQSGERRRGLVLLLGMIVILFALVLLFGKNLIDQRLAEMEYLLEDSAGRQDVNNAFLIRSKLRLLKKRLTSMREDRDDVLDEGKMQRLLATGEWDLPPERPELRPGLTGLVSGSLRLIMGKPWSLVADKPEGNPVLEAGYQLEMARRYREAIVYYESGLERGRFPGKNVERYVYLHLGFCYAMLGEFDRTRALYQVLLADAVEVSEIKILTDALLAFIIDVERRKKSLDTGLSQLERAERLFAFRDFKGVEQAVAAYLESGPGGENRRRALYLLGRLLEEQGEHQAAIHRYADVLQGDAEGGTAGFWGRMANRRLFLVSRFYESDKAVAGFSKSSAAHYRDDALFSELEKIEIALPRPPEPVRRPPRPAAPPRKPAVAAPRLPILAQTNRKPLGERLTNIQKEREERSRPKLPDAVKAQVDTLVSRNHRVVYRIAMRGGNAVFIGAIIGTSGDQTIIDTASIGTINIRSADIESRQVLYSR